MEQQWQKKVKSFSTMSDKTNALASKPGAVQQIDLFTSFSVLFNFQLPALAKWDTRKGLFEDGAADQITATLNFTVSENFFAGPIPVLIIFAVDADLTFGFAVTLYTATQNGLSTTGDTTSSGIASGTGQAVRFCDHGRNRRDDGRHLCHGVCRQRHHRIPGANGSGRGPGLRRAAWHRRRFGSEWPRHRPCGRGCGRARL